MGRCATSLRIQLLERAGGGVAGVGKRFFPFGFEFLVDGLEFLDRHVSLAAHFQQFRRSGIRQNAAISYFRRRF